MCVLRTVSFQVVAIPLICIFLMNIEHAQIYPISKIKNKYKDVISSLQATLEQIVCFPTLLNCKSPWKCSNFTDTTVPAISS